VNNLGTCPPVVIGLLELGRWVGRDLRRCQRINGRFEGDEHMLALKIP